MQAFEVELITCTEDGTPRGSSDAGARIDGNRFELAALALGRTYALRIRAPRRLRDVDWAPVQSEPFVTTCEGITWEAGVQPWGELPVQVLDADGEPALGVRVMARHQKLVGFSPAARPVDEYGRVTLKRCAPGLHDVVVWYGTDESQEQAVTILPGLNPEVVLRLQRDGR